MSISVQFYIVNFGQIERNGGKIPYVQVLQVGRDPDDDYDDAGSFTVMPGKYWNQSLPIMSFETFKNCSDLYPPNLVQKVQRALKETEKITYPPSVKQVKSWKLWNTAQIHESTAAYA
jgi:hypothetical protein